MRYRGIDRQGRHVIGAVTEGTAAELAERLHGLGYREAEITTDSGAIVGEVGRLDGRRVWWGEDPEVTLSAVKAQLDELHDFVHLVLAPQVNPDYEVDD